MNEPIVISETARAIAKTLGSVNLPETERALFFLGALDLFKRAVEQPNKNPDEVFSEFTQELARPAPAT